MGPSRLSGRKWDGGTPPKQRYKASDFVRCLRWPWSLGEAAYRALFVLPRSPDVRSRAVQKCVGVVLQKKRVNGVQERQDLASTSSPRQMEPCYPSMLSKQLISVARIPNQNVARQGDLSSIAQKVSPCLTSRRSSVRLGEWLRLRR